MIKEGRKAPAFTLPSSTGDKLALKDLAGKYAILYFYPRDNTPGCTTEANDFNKALRKIKARGAVVVGVSRAAAPPVGLRAAPASPRTP